MANHKKILTDKEKRFARLLFDGVGPIEAARSIFKWKCEQHTPEYQKARDMARARRIVEEVERLKGLDKKQAAARELVGIKNAINFSDIRAFAFERLVEVRDSATAPGAVRHRAILALEKLKDPASDVNLIFKWIDIMWRYYTAHCPCCHTDFPLWKVKNQALERYWRDEKLERPQEIEDPLVRKLALLERARPAKPPHPGQVPLIAAEERHIVGTGPARVGKSVCLGMFGFMYLMIPGAEIWLLSQTYEMCKNEFEYIVSYLNTLFYPIGKHIFTINHDKKSDEASISTEWASALQTKSGHAKASITGREIEAGLVAEPAWVDAELYEELRARLSSRLGRIIALGTPKGFGGFLIRMLRQGARSMSTGKKINPEDRLLANGCSWDRSLFMTHLKPEDNPEYVVSELEAAKDELTEAEWRSEFGGEVFAAEGAKFPYIRPEHLQSIEYDRLRKCNFVQGVDQGERNFGSVTVGWDGHNAYVMNEYFDNSDKTIKSNMVYINANNEYFIRKFGGNPENWKLTIFDADPPVQGMLKEMELERQSWKTDITFRPKNRNEQENWRAEVCSWINELARQDRLFFSAENCEQLHDQFLEVINRPEKPGTASDTINNRDKGWIVHHWRKDHVLDAALLAFWTIYSQELPQPAKDDQFVPGTAFEEAERQQTFMRRLDEKRELTGYTDSQEIGYNKIFEKSMGRPAPTNWDFMLGRGGYYDDES